MTLQPTPVLDGNLIAAEIEGHLAALDGVDSRRIKLSAEIETLLELVQTRHVEATSPEGRTLLTALARADKLTQGVARDKTCAALNIEPKAYRRFLRTLAPPAPKKPAPKQESEVAIMDNTPAVVNRPLCLREDRAYLTTWLHLQITRHTTTDDDGREVVLARPEVENRRTLAVLRDDGALFIGDGYPQLDAKPLADLGLDVNLPNEAPPDKCLSGGGLKRYRAGYRPDPVSVFKRVVDVVDRFLDFDHSLADQRTMCEMVACFVLTSYFLDAFEISPYLWPNGDRGSGKTTLLQVVAELSYLGQVILAGGSYASLRDLADYGAVLAFDDAENLAGGKRNQDRVDPDKRALLLAGNRKGNFVTVKEPADAKGKSWRTRYVSTFCPRAYAAIQLPDPILASRSIVVPLVPTLDRAKANSSPVDYKLWPHNRRTLLDDLWLLALGCLCELRTAPLERCSDLIGRSLEPWESILPVACWLEQHGVKELGGRMVALAQSYQAEKTDLETYNPAVHVVRALADLVEGAATDPLKVTSAEIAARVKELTSEDEGGASEDGLNMSTKTVGRLLRSLRLPKKLPRPRNRGPHTWEVCKADVGRMCAVYGLKDTKDTPPPSNSAEGAQSANGAETTQDAPLAPFALCAPFTGGMPQMTQETAQDPWDVEVANAA